MPIISVLLCLHVALAYYVCGHHWSYISNEDYVGQTMLHIHIEAHATCFNQKVRSWAYSAFL